MWLIDTIWTIGDHLFPPILSNFDPNCLTFFYTTLQNFHAKYASPSFFWISCRNLCRISMTALVNETV